jgi:hypothetical protein
MPWGLRVGCNFCDATVFLWHQPTDPMKTALISVLTATLLGFASLASGRHFDAADFTAIVFTTGLVAWTVGQYNRAPRVLTLTRPIQLPDRANLRPIQPQVVRQAA